METLKNLFETLKEMIKNQIQSQQESAFVTQLKEKYAELPPQAQKLVLWGSGAFFVIMVFWWPLSNLIDASDLNAQFDEKRNAIKELLKIQRDVAEAPQIPTPPTPSTLKPQFDQRIAAMGIKPEQVHESRDLGPNPVFGTEEKGVLYKIDHITIRQALDVAFELEHIDPSLRLKNFSLTANPTDPHYYTLSLSLINFAPKVSLAEPGGALIDAIKKKNNTTKSTNEEKEL